MDAKGKLIKDLGFKALDEERRRDENIYRCGCLDGTKF